MTTADRRAPLAPRARVCDSYRATTAVTDHRHQGADSTPAISMPVNAPAARRATSWRWYRIGSFSPAGLCRYAAGRTASSIRRRWLGVVRPARSAIAAPPAVDYAALEPVVTSPGGGDELLRRARDAALGRVEILGYGTLDFSLEDAGAPASLLWNIDPRTGTRWTADGAGGGVRVTGPACGDIKIPWELSRAHHWVLLAGAFGLSGDPSLLRSLTGQWRAWLRENSAPRGVNWLVPMEAAIRAINWFWTLVLLRRATGRDHADPEIARSLVEHGRFIDLNLEYSDRPSDHYLSNLVGLLYLGSAFRSASFGRRWIRMARRGLGRRARIDIDTEGGFPAGSVGYHRLVTELYRHGLAVCRSSGRGGAPPWSALLPRLEGFADDLTRPDGTAIAFGDGDDGRVVPASPSVGAGPTRTPRARSVAYPRSGFYVMRSDDSGGAIDAFSERPNLPFGYRHNSRLSVELWVRGRAFVVDPGTYCYGRSPRKRHYFRSARVHNVSQVDRLEQNRSRPADLAWLGGEAVVRVLQWRSTEAEDHFEAALGSYARLARPPVRYIRTVGFMKRPPIWWIRDRFEGRGEHRLDFRLTFAPAFRCRLLGRDEVACEAPDVHVRLWLDASFPFTARLQSAFVSPHFGSKERTLRLQLSGRSTLPAHVTCLVVPHGGEGGPDLDRLRAAFLRVSRGAGDWPATLRALDETIHGRDPQGDH